MESSEAGTSSGNEYQVFLNFRGPDTRNGFTDCLYHSLIDAGICVFRDSEKLHVGERIDGALRRAIDNSRIYIPIFSQNYALSQWCLRELAQIVKNTSKSNGNKEILPIFFDVEPDDVKMKTPLYRNAILNLGCKKTLSTEEIESWKKALEEVDAIKGWEVKKYDGQGELIKLVVEEVVNKLMIKDKSVTEHLIGIDDRVLAVKKLLDVDSGGGRLIQIHGMGGIGKTTLAKVVFNELSTHFGKSCYFLEDVREKSSRRDGLVELQRKFLSEVGNAVGIGSIDATDHLMKRIEEILCNKKVFIVLDDVDKSEQVEKLVGKGALCSGSRVLITTRNNNVLRITGPKYEILKYEMELMSSDHAFQLFNRHAFNSDSPPYDDHGISKKIVSATGRLPLTIEVIGSLLRDETEEIWKETLDKLSKTLLDCVYGKLKISYDALTFEQQQIFLDIACLLIGKEKTNAIYMWNDWGLSPFRGIEVLKRMSLIKIVGNKFWMHDQLRDLGREIVREGKPNPEERSRLWIEEDILDTIKTGKVRNVEAMELCHANVHIKSEEIRRFEKLRFLGFIKGTFVGNLKDCFPKLCWIDWYGSALKCELTNMCLKNVVVVNLSYIAVADMDNMKLWSLIKEASKLKVLRVDSCSGITRIPDLSGCSTLERLNFLCCYKLRKIDGSIGQLQHLIELKFDRCFDLEGLPEGIEDLRKLEHFCLEGCSEKVRLPNSIFKWKSLRELQLSIVDPVELPNAIRKLEKLEVLQVEGNLKGQLPSEIGLLPRLQKLVLKWCDEIQELPALPISLTHLAVSSRSMQVVPNLSNLTKLVELYLNGGIETSKLDRMYTGDLRWIGKLSNLERLTLCLLHVPAPTELALLPRLNQLRLFGLDFQPSTQVLSSLLDLTLGNFNSIALLSSDLKNLSNLRLESSQMQAIQLDGHQLPNLTDLDLFWCGPLERFMLSSMRKLKRFKVNNCPKLYEIHIAGKLESLERLDIGLCGSFGRFVYDDMPWESSHEYTLFLASGVFNKLGSLWIQDCPNILSIQIVDTSESLKWLELSFLHLRGLGGLSNLKNLRVLRIWKCDELRIVEGLDELEFLDSIYFDDCKSLENLIDVSTTQLPYDCHLLIIDCPKLCGAKRGFNGSIQRFKHYKEEESVPAALTDRLMPAEGSAQEQMCVPGKMEEPLAPVKSTPGSPFLEDQKEEEEEEDPDTGKRAAAPATSSAAVAAADPTELVGEHELQQQHVAVEGGQGDVEASAVHFQGQAGGDQEKEDYSQAKRQRT